MRELEFFLKAENTLSDLEQELREICDSHNDIYSSEHIQTREALKALIATRNELKVLSISLSPKSEFDLGKLF